LPTMKPAKTTIAEHAIRALSFAGLRRSRLSLDAGAVDGLDASRRAGAGARALAVSAADLRSASPADRLGGRGCRGGGLGFGRPFGGCRVISS
jgi:hypothetical protein